MTHLKHIHNQLLISFCVLGFGASVAAADPVLLARIGDLSSETPAVRVQAARDLGKLGDRRATEPLARALRDSDKDICRAAAKALGQIRDSRAVGDLTAALSDQRAVVRTEAASALGEIRDAKAAGALLRALDDPVWAVRDQAAWALHEIGFDAGNSPAEICDPFQGIIDEVKIFRAALSADEIQEQAEIEK